MAWSNLRRKNLKTRQLSGPVVGGGLLEWAWLAIQGSIGEMGALVPDATTQEMDYKDYWVLPGEQDICYLFFAGKRLFYQNPFELVMPRDADAAEREAARLRAGR